MTKKLPTNFTAYVGSLDIGDISIGCEYDGARYHIWLDRESLLPSAKGSVAGVLYKNSLAAYGEEGYFSTKHLCQDTELGRRLVPQMLNRARHLVAEERKRLVKERAEQDKKNEEEAAEERVREAVPELLEALKVMVAMVEYNGLAPRKYDDKCPYEPTTEGLQLMKAKAAIQKAEVGS